MNSSDAAGASVVSGAVVADAHSYGASSLWT